MNISDKELKKICMGFRRGIIGKKSSEDRCAEVSFALQGYLSWLGLETKVVEGDVNSIDQIEFDCNHLWLELSDGRVIDLTADQFNTGLREFPKVHIGLPLPHVHVKRRKAKRNTA